MELPSSYVCYKQKRNNLRKTTWMVAITAMPEKHCIGVTLNDDNDAEEFCCQEITGHVACFVATVRSQFHRARNMRQKALWRIAVDQGVIAGLDPGKELYGANRSIHL